MISVTRKSVLVAEESSFHGMFNDLYTDAAEMILKFSNTTHHSIEMKRMTADSHVPNENYIHFILKFEDLLEYRSKLTNH
jgi:hypothetical protein